MASLRMRSLTQALFVMVCISLHRSGCALAIPRNKNVMSNTKRNNLAFPSKRFQLKSTVGEGTTFVRLAGKKHDDDDSDQLQSKSLNVTPENGSPTSSSLLSSLPVSLPELAVVLAITIVFAAQIYDLNQYPTREFDLDTFLALKGIFDSSSSVSILELPPLVPSDQIVGALFGQPY